MYIAREIYYRILLLHHVRGTINDTQQATYRLIHRLITQKR